MKSKIPNWIKKVKRNAKARERYFMKRYGNLNRMHAKDQKLEAERLKEDSDNEWGNKGI